MTTCLRYLLRIWRERSVLMSLQSKNFKAVRQSSKRPSIASNQLLASALELSGKRRLLWVDWINVQLILIWESLFWKQHLQHPARSGQLFRDHFRSSTKHRLEPTGQKHRTGVWVCLQRSALYHIVADAKIFTFILHTHLEDILDFRRLNTRSLQDGPLAWEIFENLENRGESLGIVGSSGDIVGSGDTGQDDELVWPSSVMEESFKNLGKSSDGGPPPTSKSCNFWRYLNLVPIV